MSSKTQPSFSEARIALVGISAGALLGVVFFGGIQMPMWRWVSAGWDKVGITILALGPLFVWSIWVALMSRNPASEKNQLTLAYIGTTAQRFGLVGTVIGIVVATVAIGTHMGNGAEAAVTRALPAVGHALISTGVGFGIAILCDFFRYLSRRRECDSK